MLTPQIRTDTSPEQPYGAEHDACALILSVRKRGESTYGTLKRALGALANMGHRTGFVDGEGDGAGVQTDIPRELWARRLSRNGLRASLATDPGFWMGHVFIPRALDLQTVRERLHEGFAAAGLQMLIDQPGRVRPEALGRQGSIDPPRFWQIAGCSDATDVEARLLRAQTALEQALQVHFASLSTTTVVYKARGSVEMLMRYYPDLQDRSYHTAMALCHARYSTNTVSSFERVQPFALLGHNGEINTISRFRQEATQLGVALDPGSSDSQDVDRTLHTLCAQHGLDPIEALELLFPPVPHELDLMPPPLREAYTHLRHAFGPYAQGPAAIVARAGDIAVGGVDALGLRPLWFIETEKEYVLSSERGVLHLETMVRDARPLAPGERIALVVRRGQGVDILDHAAIRRHVAGQVHQRQLPPVAAAPWRVWDTSESPGGGEFGPPSPGGAPVQTHVRRAVERALLSVAEMVEPIALPWHAPARVPTIDTTVLAATGWNREHLQEIESLAAEGKDLVGSLGHDGPLAVLSRNRVNLADFYKETVAVVTNPAIDRERETEAFATKTLVGVRPSLSRAPEPDDLLIVLETPLLPGGHPNLGDEALAHEIAGGLGTLTIDELIGQFGPRAAILPLAVREGEDVRQALDRLAADAIAAVRDGAQCVALDDSAMLERGLGWLDPHLATAIVDRALREAPADDNLRRRAGIVVRSASIRTLHDIALLCGFGADAISPYAMLLAGIGANKSKTAIQDEHELIERQRRLLTSLTHGLEKVISTIGCHELRGYGRLFSAIGLAPSLAEALDTPNYFGSEQVGLTWERLNREADERRAELRGEAKAQLARVDRFYPKFWKKAEAVAHGEMTLDEFIAFYRELTVDVPVALRHVIGFMPLNSAVDPDTVDLGVGHHDLPVLISAMSFGSQGELAYRAYAEAARQLNILCVNGEGGELPDMMDGRYTLNRGQQVASGRFGVNAQFLNSACVLEIKIGQGAKPGEGGLLPGYKVTPQVAEARRTSPYVTLISPSNNHDIYSIEDLAQLIEELKTVNPQARVSVKIPVVPGVGIIAVGVAKAGADIIDLTGYDGATGAARKHALQYVGLPTEIGVIQAHRALIDAGLRDRVELWCDGGMKTGSDAVKMILLGANRVGFATMAMVAMGCTICRKCNEGTCHVGITTHIKTVEEAQAQGIKSFEPRDPALAVEGIVRVFGAIGEEMRRLTARLGATRLQDLVGRADLLEQVDCLDMVDLSAMCAYHPMKARPEAEPGVGRRLTRPRNMLTKLITDLAVSALDDSEREATYQDEAMAYDRALGSHLAGEMVRNSALSSRIDRMHLNFGPSSLAGNGFAAWTIDRLDILIEGGAQDGAAKGANGGRVAIMKGLNHNGLRLDGSVGKSFAYGAQRGTLIVQGDADSRACVRLSGADVIFGGELTQPIDDSEGVLGTRANLKGFACEYMTSGRVVILGDPGPYAFAGMTGGVVYQQLSPELGLDERALRRRLGRGAKVAIQPLEDGDIASLQELLAAYITALEQTDQLDTADRIHALARTWVLQQRFVKIVPA